MGHRSKLMSTDDESGEAFTDGDFDDSGDDTIAARARNKSHNETVDKFTNGHSSHNGCNGGLPNGDSVSQNGDQSPSIVGIIGDQHNHVCILNNFSIYWS